MKLVLLACLVLGVSAQCTVESAPAKSLGECQNCFTGAQCIDGYFCCPYMKKCVASSSMSCSSTSGPSSGPFGKCNPRCYDSAAPDFSSCTGCAAPDFPNKWLGVYEGKIWKDYAACAKSATSGKSPTAPTKMPTTAPPTNPTPVTACPDATSCSAAKCASGSKTCMTSISNGVIIQTYKCSTCTGNIVPPPTAPTPPPPTYAPGVGCNVDDVAPNTLTKCQNCFTSAQCIEGYFCCSYMKKCVASSSMSCSSSSGPKNGAFGGCNPRCRDNEDMYKCTGCTAPSFPNGWLGKYDGEKWLGPADCASGGNDKPTAKPPSPTPKPPTPQGCPSMPDISSCSAATCPNNVKPTCAEVSAGTGTYTCGACTGKIVDTSTCKTVAKCSDASCPDGSAKSCAENSDGSGQYTCGSLCTGIIQISITPKSPAPTNGRTANPSAGAAPSASAPTSEEPSAATAIQVGVYGLVLVATVVAVAVLY